ncbi:Hypothetical_protein [Hexamita inflata]|uniref:Hypothetical_protein n=1 Tax=Hexamita inflata TaxID=28002 RepID=A0AA86NK47_9EUKA|nr:Hypothetical protein HINF_LOCUS8458 [Hexamita inflata]
MPAFNPTRLTQLEACQPSQMSIQTQYSYVLIDSIFDDNQNAKSETKVQILDQNGINLVQCGQYYILKRGVRYAIPRRKIGETEKIQLLQLWEVELLFLVYYVSNYILKYFATSNADDKFQQIISSWRLFMNYSLTQEGQKYDFDRIRPQSTIQSRYLIFQKGKIEITTCNKRTAMTKINAVEDVQGRSTNSLNKLRQF